MRRTMLIAALLIPQGALLAESNVSPDRKWAWGENIGWLNWRDAEAGAAGAQILPSPDDAQFLAGFVWSENVGWINLGYGSPTDGTAYANATGADAGVNVDPITGELSGLAWGENIGWINFDTASLAGFGQNARYDRTARRLRGYAWGENVGWINLDHPVHYVAFGASCAGDIDGDGDIDFDDLAILLGSFESGPGGDINGDGATDFEDLAILLGVFGTDC